MADKKVSALTAITQASADDLLMIVNDPGGTPASRKITHANFFANVHTVSDFTSNVTISSTKLTVSANTTLSGALKNGSSTIIGSNGKIHANNAITANTITSAMITFDAVSNNALQSYIANTNPRFAALTTNTAFQAYIANTNPRIAQNVADILDRVDRTTEVQQNMTANLAVDVGSTVATSGVHISNGHIKMFSATSSPSKVDFYCETNNAHYARLQAPAHADFSGSIVLTLPNVSGNVATTNSETFTGTTSAHNLNIGGTLRILDKSTDPSSSNAASEGISAGSIFYSNTHLYVATDSNTIKRVALSTF
tara:strand:+ start:72 stop:1004 length:933 start_codon:yes stop_codon:yes gene_type:complete